MRGFEGEGPGTLLALDNGDLSDLTSPKAADYRVFAGKALAIVQSTAQPGSIRLSASSAGLRKRGTPYLSPFRPGVNGRSDTVAEWPGWRASS